MAYGVDHVRDRNERRRMAQQTIEATAFGRVLGAFMASRGIPAEPERVAELAERSGLEPEGFLARVTGEVRSYSEDLSGLARELELFRQEKRVLANAYAFEEELGVA
jgi:hypothetical protein